MREYKQSQPLPHPPSPAAIRFHHPSFLQSALILTLLVPYDYSFDCPRNISLPFLMMEPTLSWSMADHIHLPVDVVQYHGLTMTEIEICESQIERERTKLASAKWLVNQRNRLENGLTKYPDNTEFTIPPPKRASQGRNFNTLFDKYFTGKDWEIHIMRTLRPDIFILLCVLFVPTEFKEIHDKALQDVFAEEVNKNLPTGLVIHSWAAEMAKSRINSTRSEIDPESPDAKQLLEVLNPYVSQTPRPSGRLLKYPAIALASTKPPQSTTSDTVDAHIIDVDEPQRQWSNNEYAQRQDTPAESHSIGADNGQTQWSNRGSAPGQNPPLELPSLPPPSTGQILQLLPSMSSIGILSNTPNKMTPFNKMNGDLLWPTSQLPLRVLASGYDGGNYPNWAAPELQSSYGLRQSPYSAASVSPPSNNATHKGKSTGADEDGFVNVSQDEFAQEAQMTHKQTENEESAPKKQRLNPFSQSAPWGDSARSMELASERDGRSAGGQTGIFRSSTEYVSGYSEFRQLPLPTYSSGNNSRCLPLPSMRYHQ